MASGPQPTGEPGELPASGDQEARTWATLTHLSTLAGYVTAVGFIVGPLVMWLLRKDQWEFVDDQGKESLNFNISFFIYAVVSAILVFVLIGILLLIALAVLHLVLTIVAAVNANNGVRYRYPLIIRFVQ